MFLFPEKVVNWFSLLSKYLFHLTVYVYAGRCRACLGCCVSRRAAIQGWAHPMTCEWWFIYTNFVRGVHVERLVAVLLNFHVQCTSKPLSERVLVYADPCVKTLHWPGTQLKRVFWIKCSFFFARILSVLYTWLYARFLACFMSSIFVIIFVKMWGSNTVVNTLDHFIHVTKIAFVVFIIQFQFS